jgi:hypothetical protein
VWSSGEGDGCSRRQNVEGVISCPSHGSDDDYTPGGFLSAHHVIALAPAAKHVKIARAMKQRFAHLTSTRRISRMNVWRSDSVFSGIQRVDAGGGEGAGRWGVELEEGDEDEEGKGSRSGENRMRAPRIQKGGNTIQSEISQQYKGEELEARTKSIFEKIHGECGRLWCHCGVLRQSSVFSNICRKCIYIRGQLAVMTAFACRTKEFNYGIGI